MERVFWDTVSILDGDENEAWESLVTDAEEIASEIHADPGEVRRFLKRQAEGFFTRGWRRSA